MTLGREAVAQQAEAERQRQVERTFRDALRSGGEGPQMVVVAAGSFMMGWPTSEEGWDSERPAHRVTIGQAFAVMVYEVTRGEYGRFVSATGDVEEDSCGTLERNWFQSYRWNRRSGRSWRNPGFRQTEQEPVVCVSWRGAQAYVTWLSQETEQAYRLLSEAEWEYVARAGTTTSYWWGDAVGRNRANCFGCGSQWDRKRTAPVGSFRPNPFGLYDVHGNVWE